MMSHQEQLQIVINKIKTILKSKGINTIRQLGKSFRGFNSFEKNRIDRDEFHVALKENAVLLSKQQSDLLLNSLDKRDGTIDVQEFLAWIRGVPNQARLDVIHQAFKKFDKDNQGYLLVEDLRGIYNPINHPKVIRGELTVDQVFLEFLENFSYANKAVG
ncbi:hypothetical protein pb186bvf_021085 [Paramecium bursaria]